MEQLILLLACCFVAYVIGYKSGMRYCIDVFKEEMEKHKEEQKNGNV